MYIYIYIYVFIFINVSYTWFTVILFCTVCIYCFRLC